MKKAFLSKGFTLVELLMVLAIIGILTGIVMASTSSARSAARDTRRISDMKEIQLSLALYFDVKKSYPAALGDMVADRFIAEVPTDPQGGSYQYLRYNSNKNYCIGVTLEGTVPEDNVTHAVNSNCDPLTSNYKAQSPK